MDFRQCLAAVLTMSMFVMLGNMVKKEHVDPFLGYVPIEAELELKTAKYSSHRRVKLSTTLITRPWMDDQQPLKPCSTLLPHDDSLKSRGDIFFELSHEPEYHAFQVGIAIMIARQLGAALVLPDISRNNKNKDKRLFGEIYDINHFITTLEGIVNVVKDPPTPLKQQSKENIIKFRISNTISEQMIQTKINPLFKKGKQLRFTFHLGSSSSSFKGNMNPYTCLAMFRSLKLQSELQGVVDSIVGTLRSWSSKSFGKFVAVDLRTDENGFKSNGLEKNFTENRKEFNDPRGIAEFLKRFGFERETSIYLSQVGRNDESLVSLRQYFPSTFTKEAIFPMELKPKYLNSEDTEFRKLIDLHVCTQSDVFVSGFHDQFQKSVVAMRIGLGKTHILKPEETSSSSTTFAADIVPTYVSKKTHMAYSCFC